MKKIIFLLLFPLFVLGQNQSVNIPIVTSIPTVVVNAGTGISIGGMFPTFTITNTSPSLTVTIGAGTATSIQGTYPTFTVTNTSPLSNLSISAGTGISVSASNPYTITNSSPDQTVSLKGAGTSTVSGTYPTFTITTTGNTSNNRSLSNAGPYTSSTSATKMAGLTFTITPTKSGTIYVIISFSASDGSGLFKAATLKRGTGTPPVSGAASTGTSISQTTEANLSTESHCTLVGFATGLTLGTTIWIDLAASIDDGLFGDGTVTDVDMVIFEL